MDVFMTVCGLQTAIDQLKVDLTEKFGGIFLSIFDGLKMKNKHKKLIE